jgi:hypothetical protein
MTLSAILDKNDFPGLERGKGLGIGGDIVPREQFLSNGFGQLGDGFFVLPVFDV